jgi:hypothetical protein
VARSPCWLSGCAGSHPTKGPRSSLARSRRRRCWLCRTKSGHSQHLNSSHKAITPGLSAIRKLSRNGVRADQNGQSSVASHFLRPDFWPVIRSQPGIVCRGGRGPLSKKPVSQGRPRGCSVQKRIAGHSSILTRVTRVASPLPSGPNISASPSAKPDANCGNAPVMFGR